MDHTPNGWTDGWMDGSNCISKLINHLEFLVDTLVDLLLVDASESLQDGNGPLRLPLRQQPPVELDGHVEKCFDFSHDFFQ